MIVYLMSLLNGPTSGSGMFLLYFEVEV